MTKDTGIVKIHNKEYFTVAKRVGLFRNDFENWTISTEIISINDKYVIMKCIISDETGRLISSGHAEEIRGSTTINKTSALENCETSCIGRALAAFKYAGTEFASADEVSNAIIQQNNIPSNNNNSIENKTCSKCGAKMSLKAGKYGDFWGCSNYPECKNIEKHSAKINNQTTSTNEPPLFDDKDIPLNN